MRYTTEEEAFLLEFIEVCDSYADLTRRLNEKFGTERKMECVREKCTNGLHLRIGKNTGRFTERSQQRALPVGTIRRSQTGTYIKVQEVPPGTYSSGYRKPWWVPLQEKIWTDEHGAIPEGHMICFLDNNPQNFSPNNLYPITRAASVRMAQNKWWSSDPRITKTGIMYCNLLIALKRE